MGKNLVPYFMCALCRVFEFKEIEYLQKIRVSFHAPTIGNCFLYCLF